MVSNGNVCGEHGLFYIFSATLTLLCRNCGRAACFSNAMSVDFQYVDVYVIHDHHHRHRHCQWRLHYYHHHHDYCYYYYHHHPIPYEDKLFLFSVSANSPQGVEDV